MGKRDMNLIYKVRTILLERGHKEGLSYLDSGRPSLKSSLFWGQVP